MLYLSLKLSNRETRYSIIEKGFSAIRWAILTLRYCLLGQVIHSLFAPRTPPVASPYEGYQRTDHPLALQPFKLMVVHRPGAQMAVVDFLSKNGRLQAGWLPGLSRAVGECGKGAW